ncbi:MAG: gliding motility-associated C-terminal domain-containing protein [Bacteroidota bacterium]|nr:gliding motility-associated C-terminal domain-containing protein [Bacteroidota bacterium]
MRVCHFQLRLLLLGLVFCPGYFVTNAQTCPYNIDFETGTFAGWQSYIGTADTVNGVNVLDLQPTTGPVFNRQTMYTANTGAGVDPYGGFPVNCPNGSKHSIRLGNNSAGTQAEGISYEFTIPSGMNIYSLIYHYAVVFQDPNHKEYQQPRLVIEITNVTDNKTIYCSSFTFIPYGTLLPGFFQSPNPGGSTPVWCKNWSAVSVNLDGNAGKKIRLFFKTADCTFKKHFGYAYLDVNSECSSEFVGSAYCKDDTAVNLTAPFGYQNYSWYDNTFTKVLGSQQTITFQPPPSPGSTFPVIVVPYNGYGCVDTLYAKLNDSLSVTSRAGRDTLSCNLNPVPIGDNTIPGLVYSWSPVTGLSDPKISNPLATPDKTTSYILITSHDGGGCRSDDTVLVTASVIDSSLRLTGNSAFCSSSSDSAVLHVQPTKRIQWYNDGGLIVGANGINYRVTKSGSYDAWLINNEGCSLSTRVQKIFIDNPVPPIKYPDVYAVINFPFSLKARQFGDNVLWSPGTSLNSTASYTPVFTGLFDQLYTIEIKTIGGCLTVDTQIVKVVRNIDILVPTAFTPNSDGLNDILRPILFGITKLYYFKIFNRFGQQLFETTNAEPGWDGTLKGVHLGPQVVVWIAEGVGVDNKIYIRKGSCLLVR